MKMERLSDISPQKSVQRAGLKEHESGMELQKKPHTTFDEMDGPSIESTPEKQGHSHQAENLFRNSPLVESIGSSTHLAGKQEYLKLFNTPVERGRTFPMKVKQHVSKLGLAHPQYDFYLEQQTTPLCSAFKQGLLSADYRIYLHENQRPHDPQNYIGRVINNIFGSGYSLYDDGESKLNQRKPKSIGYVEYQTKWNNPFKPRVVEAYLPNPEATALQQPKDAEEMKKIYSTQNRKDYKMLITKAPIWDEARKVYKLDFRGRVRMNSSKNFIMMDTDFPEEVPEPLLFGKFNENEYHLEVSYPLSPLQAMQIALTALAFKFTCQ